MVVGAGGSQNFGRVFVFFAAAAAVAAVCSLLLREEPVRTSEAPAGARRPRPVEGT
ncbi:MAG: hypothetical protein M3P70_00645 [Actinomycetota bacterium]|nr:hypothetical protein [Actinomycetota bacterium]